ncbi:MAG TPA: four helix bundle protein [Candidatus Wunengus californicus]|uniref:four helix bundle protein n=1 Tax=Candidatus Wunengus californicus TaxID=3367619 RepID=UPI0040274EFE
MIHDTLLLMENEMPQSYKDLAIYMLAKESAVKVHKMTLDKLPKFEMYEEGSQIRRSSKSIVSNIVEGFGRRRYKNEFVLYLTYAIASCDETKVHLEMLYETGSIKKDLFEELFHGYEELFAKLFNFREAVIKSHRT